MALLEGFTQSIPLILSRGRFLSVGATILCLAQSVPTQAQASSCGEAPDSAPYRRYLENGSHEIPGYREVLARWNECNAIRADELMRQAKEAWQIANDLRNNGGQEAVASSLTSQIDNVMGTTSSAPSAVIEHGKELIAEVYRTPAGGSGVANVVGRTATTASLEATAQAAANFDAAMARTMGASDQFTPVYAPTFGEVRSSTNADARVAAFETATARTALHDGGAVARMQSDYEQRLEEARDDAASVNQMYRDRAAARRAAADDATFAVAMARANVEAWKSSRSTTEARSGLDDADRAGDWSTELGSSRCARGC
ncbi:hypothetical protein [Croceibacterium ferulae]|uniref:hypothetical protein n=1 Tax=Croceibacterium ferulae TaxID=1854641 RepID=UPI000F8734B6|nr:hypothetical protein [Croceibacterium ferulae]